MGISKDVPLCTQQWNGLIAVNYAARAFGIRRHCTVEEALEKCPGLKLVHVATFASGETEPKYHDKVTPQTHKVSLEPYRRASKAVFAILQRFGCVLQRASVDEAFIDAEKTVEAQMESVNLDSVSLDFSDLGAVVCKNTDSLGKLGQSTQLCLVENTAANRRLYLAAQLAKRMRQTIFDELGYTCSAGISHNKTLAKLGSSLNKPNQQSVILAEEAEAFVATVPVSKVPLLGGKFGAQICEKLGDSETLTCGAVAKLELQYLIGKFGSENGAWLYNISRGLCNAPVVEQITIKGMMSAKSFRPYVSKLEELRRWILVLSSELYTRVYEVLEETNSWPKTLTLHYRIYPELQERSRSVPFPSRFKITSIDAIVQLACSSILSDKMLPCSRLSLQLNGLETLESSSNIELAFTKLCSSAADEGSTEKCKQCGRKLRPSEVQSHADWHVALAIANEQQQEVETRRSAATLNTLSSGAVGGRAPKKSANRSMTLTTNKNSDKPKANKSKELFTAFFKKKVEE